MTTPREVPRPFAMPWGKGEIIEEATAVGEYHEPAIQLLRYEDGSLSVRFCHYDHRGRFQRSPLMVSDDTIARLRRSLRDTPRLRKLVARLVGAPSKGVR
ncbi:MAG TPA: hypothetical protein VGQ86_00075 [Candidatus Limnocylindria bacterium]|jgi:hypothetical protein|nr:hypothetical protein [Candidatus Limnocylindria bacterium]